MSLLDKDIKNFIKSFCIGITGSIGSGKSTVSRMIEDRGFRVISADTVSKEAYRKNSLIYNDLLDLVKDLARSINQDVSLFLDRFENISPSSLISYFIQDESLFKKFESVIHPWVNESFYKICGTILSENPNKIFFYESALLIETGFYTQLRSNLLVSCSQCIREKRVRLRASQSKELIDFLSSKQLSDDQKKIFCDFIIQNDEDFYQLESRIDEFLSLV